MDIAWSAWTAIKKKCSWKGSSITSSYNQVTFPRDKKITMDFNDVFLTQKFYFI